LAVFAYPRGSYHPGQGKFGQNRHAPPYRYQVWAGDRSLEQIVREGILRTGAPLHEEPLTLVREEHGIRDPRRYFGVLAAIASGRTRNAQIGSLLELPSSNVAVVLERLASLGYIEERMPVVPGARRRRGFWRLRDPFFNFWFRRVQPNRSCLDREEAIDSVWEQIAADLDTYVGRIFEDVCRRWLGRYSEVEEARAAITIGSWFARRGFTRRLQRRAARENVLLVNASDLFRVPG